MNYNFETKNVAEFQPNWCCGEDPYLFKERWDKLFQEFISVEKLILPRFLNCMIR